MDRLVVDAARRAEACDRSTLVLSEIARWLPSGQGRADIAVSAGPFFGTLAVECWDAQFRVTYASKPWENPPLVGNAASCAL